jgi:hypothetical protein
VTRTARDSVSPGAIPLDGTDMVFGYAPPSDFAWSAADFARFGKAGKQVARIDDVGTAWQAASILDVERGAATPAMAPDWIRARHSFRGDPVVYCDEANLPAVLGATSLVTCTWWLWIALWDGSPDMPALSLPSNVRLLGKQYLNTPGYDQSAIVADDWHRP